MSRLYVSGSIASFDLCGLLQPDFCDSPQAKSTPKSKQFPRTQMGDQADTAQNLSSATGSPLPTLKELQRDLRTIANEGFRGALALPLPAISALPPVKRATELGTLERDKEIERLLRACIANLGDPALALVTAPYLGLDNKAEHEVRLETAATNWGIARSGSGRQPVTFLKIRLTKLEPMLARELLKRSEAVAAPGRVQAPMPEQVADSEPPLGELFEPCHEGRAAKDRELAAARDRDASVWWPEGSSGWFGNYFAFWYKALTIPCHEVQIVRDQGYYGAGRFGLDSKLDGPRDKLTVTHSTWFHTDPPTKALYCGITNWGFAFAWASDNTDLLLNTPFQPSAFGVADRIAYPGVASVHTLMQTSDGYLVFGLRSQAVDYYKLMWSASFEESISVDARKTGPRSGDATVLDTIIGGLQEEWGIHASRVAESTLLAVGREYVRISPKRLELNSAILTAVRLSVDLDAVWRSLDDRAKVQDLDEHLAWVGVRFDSRADLLRLLAFARGRADGTDLFPEFQELYPGSCDVRFYSGESTNGVTDHGLMPTSAARLYLGSRWLQL